MINGSQTLNGTFGSIFYEGEFLSNVQSFEAAVEFNKEEINLAGKRFTSFKVMGMTGSGSMNGYFVSSRFLTLIAQVAKDGGKPFYCELIGKIEDPEMNGKVYRVRLKNVSFNGIPLLNYEVNSLIEQELEFNFEGFDILDEF